VASNPAQVIEREHVASVSSPVGVVILAQVLGHSPQTPSESALRRTAASLAFFRTVHPYWMNTDSTSRR
jgi:hypothetical protein